MTATVEAPRTHTATSVKNPHRIPTLITGWAVIAVFLGAMWGASHHPENAGVSAAAVVLMAGLYLTNKIRQIAYNRRERRAGSR